MTESPVPAVAGQPGQDLATIDPNQFASTGLDDMSMSDAIIPRIRIEHKEGVWKDNLTNQPIVELRFIALGLVKQRVLFHPNVEDGDVPMCKSSDFNLGFPNPDAPRNKSFPWEKSGFDPADFPANQAGTIQLPCEGCALKDWGSHPNGDTPYCSEQWTLPIYYDASDQPGPWDMGLAEWSPAILTLQKSSVKPIRQYLTSFKNANKPPFIAVGKGTLKVITRGQVTYSVPTFTKEEESPRENWLEFSEQFVEMRTYLQRPPVRESEEDGVPATPADNTNTAPPQAQQVQQQAPPAQQDPWTGQPPAQQAPPQQEQAPPPQQPEQQQVQQPAQQPVTPAQPVATPAEQPAPAQPQQQQAPQQPPAAPQPPAGQELPF